MNRTIFAATAIALIAVALLKAPVGHADLGRRCVAPLRPAACYYGDQDDRNGYAYLAELRDVGLPGSDPIDVASTARGICLQRAQGATEDDIIRAVQSRGATFEQAMAIVLHAEWHFCSDAMYTWPGH